MERNEKPERTLVFLENRATLKAELGEPSEPQPVEQLPETAREAHYPLSSLHPEGGGLALQGYIPILIVEKAKAPPFPLLESDHFLQLEYG